MITFPGDEHMKYVSIISSVLLLVACSSAPPSIQTGPDAEVTFDGLVRVNNAAFQRAWVDPDIDLSSYTKILPGEARFEFRSAKKGSTMNPRVNSSQRDFAISPENQQKLQDTVEEIFNEELASSKYYEFTEKPGPDVLIVKGAMLDIVNRVPPEMSAGMHEIYVSSFGEITLVLEIADSMSGETLARASERRALTPAGGGGNVGRANSVTTWAEVRRTSRRWAQRLREGLDAFHDGSLDASSE
jgi:hypothetical protein